MIKLSMQVDTSSVASQGSHIERMIRQDSVKAMDVIFNDLMVEAQINLSDNMLHVRSAKLVNSLNSASYSSVTDDLIAVTVGTETDYANYQEWGYQGSQQVSGYTRVTDNLFGHKVPAFTQVIGAHYRSVNYAGKPYMRTAFGRVSISVLAILRSRISNGN